MPDTFVSLIGNLTDDPDLRFTPNGAAVANFRLAVTPRVREGDAWKDGETSFFRITAWRQLAEHVGDSLSTGDRVIVLGQLRARSCETPEGSAARWWRSPQRKSAQPEVGERQAPAHRQGQRRQGRSVRRRAADLLNPR